MKKLLIFLLILFPFFTGNAMLEEETEETVRKVADYILENSNFKVVDGEVQSSYNNWEYENGVLNIGMLRLGKTMKDKRYTDFARRNIDFGFKHRDLLNIFSIHNLDDCGALGASTIDVYNMDKNPEYRKFIGKTARYITEGQVRMGDGTLCRPRRYRMTLWIDDLYMSVPFLARMGRLTGEIEYFNDAAWQVIQFTKYLFHPDKGLYYHYWYSDLKKHGVAFWGRGNGWAMMAQVELLSILPEDHPKRDTLISILHNHILGISRYQSKSGLWHQLLDKTDSYLETSSTAMFTHSIARAVNEGWIHPRYASIAIRGWEGLETKIREDGQVESTCVGTGVDENLVHYYRRPTEVNDIHSLGAILLAGSELIQLSTKFFPGEDIDGLNLSILEVPFAVRKVLKEKFGNKAMVYGIKKELENGKVFYEMEVKFQGKEAEVVISEDGKSIKVGE